MNCIYCHKTLVCFCCSNHVHELEYYEKFVTFGMAPYQFLYYFESEKIRIYRDGMNLLYDGLAPENFSPETAKKLLNRILDMKAFI